MPTQVVVDVGPTHVVVDVEDEEQDMVVLEVVGKYRVSNSWRDTIVRCV